MFKLQILIVTKQITLRVRAYVRVSFPVRQNRNILDIRTLKKNIQHRTEKSSNFSIIT